MKGLIGIVSVFLFPAFAIWFSYFKEWQRKRRKERDRELEKEL